MNQQSYLNPTKENYKIVTQLLPKLLTIINLQKTLRLVGAGKMDGGQMGGEVSVQLIICSVW